MSRRSEPSRVSTVLASSRMGMWPVVFITLSAAAPVTVINGGATAGFAITGITGIPLAYLVVGAILALFAVGYVAMSQKIVNAGAFYTYITHGLGKTAGVSAAFVAVVAYNVMQVGLYGGFGVAMVNLLNGPIGVNVPWAVWAMLGWVAVLFFGSRRIDLHGKVLATMLIGEIAVALVFAAVQVSHPAGGTITFEGISPSSLFIGVAASAALVTGIAGFIGFESGTVFSEETRDPRKTVPRATYTGVAIIAVLYCFCSLALVVAVGADQIVARATAEGSELSFNLASPYLPAVVIWIGRLWFVTSLFAALVAFHNTVARYLFALGREHVLSGWLGRTSPSTKAPFNGSIVQSAIGFTGILLFVVFDWDPFAQMFFWLTTLGGFGVLILMTFTSIAVVAYFVRDRRGVGVVRAFIAPVVSTVVLAALLVATISKFHVLIGVDAHDPVRWLLPGSFGIAAILGIYWAAVLKHTRPTVYSGIGLGVNAPAAAVSAASPERAGAR